MIKRRKLTTLDKLKVMTGQAYCPLCKEKLGALEDLDFDHERALVNGGEDTLDNLRAVHRDCHKIKTHGNGATNRGSDRGEAIKSGRMEEKRVAREAAAPRAHAELSDFSADEPIAQSRNSVKDKPKRKIQSASRWPAKKPKVPYVRRGV